MKPPVPHGPNRLLEAKADEILAPVAPTPAALASAIAEAIAMQGEFFQTTQRSFEKFAVAGRLLSAQKHALAFGEWETWLAAHVPDEYRRRERKGAAESWRRTARNWMRISDILDHCHPEAIEAAQTVSQLFRLAQFLPEGLPAPGESAGELQPAEVVARVKRWITANLSPDRIRTLPPESRTELRAQLEPLWQAVTA